MPIETGFVGIGDITYVDGIPVVAARVNRGRTMDTSSEKLIQGTLKNRVLKIGGVAQTVSVEAPILRGGGAALDSRNLLIKSLAKLFTLIDGTNLTNPAMLLNKADINIDAESGGSISLSFEGDGNPNSNILKFFGNGADALPGTPLLPSNTNSPTRTAHFYDFRIIAGDYALYIKNVKISVNVEVVKQYFFSSDTGNNNVAIPGGGPTDTPPWNPEHNPNNWGTQFPWLTISSMTINGSGSAAVKKLTKDSNGFWETSVNGGFSNSDYKLTLQEPCEVNTAQNDIKIEIFTCGNVLPEPEWVSLFHDFETGLDILDLSTSVIKMENLNYSSGPITTDFEFECWVK